MQLFQQSQSSAIKHRENLEQRCDGRSILANGAKEAIYKFNVHFIAVIAIDNLLVVRHEAVLPFGVVDLLSFERRADSLHLPGEWI